MIKDQEALARWMAGRAIIARREAIAAGSRIDGERLARLASANLDWIDAHRPMRSIGQSWEMSEAGYQPAPAPKMISAR